MDSTQSAGDDTPRTQAPVSSSPLKKAARPSQSPAVTALPKGEPRGGASGRNVCRESFSISVYRANSPCLSLWESQGGASGRNVCRESFSISVYRANSHCLSLWERWPSAARTGRVNNGQHAISREMTSHEHKFRYLLLR